MKMFFKAAWVWMVAYVGRLYPKIKSFFGGAADITRQVSMPWKKTAYVFNVAKWKRKIIRRYLWSYNVIFLSLSDDIYKKEARVRLSFRPVFIVWGRTTPERLKEFSLEYNVPIHHIEDGFFRSIGLGANHVLPYSLCYDKTGIYYDSSSPSDLESMLLNFDENIDKKLLVSAQECIDLIKKYKLSKYNEKQTCSASLIYGPKVKKRVLIIGQVEDDQSLLYGCERIMTNAELIQLAAKENPEAQLIYKPHPDVMAGLRKEISNTADCAHLAEILTIPLSLTDALHEVDHVYTLTSLAGFEALMYDVKVTTVGAPFYSGWGLTDDRQIVERRNKKLTFLQLFAVAYLKYPKYLDVDSMGSRSLKDIIEIFIEKISESEVVTAESELGKLRPYNFSTRHSVDPRFLYNSTSEEIAIVTDSADALYIARGMAARGKKITFITTRDSLANDESILLSSEEGRLIKVTSIHKRYGVSMSDVENDAVRLTKAFSDSLKIALKEAAEEHLLPDVIDAFCFGLEDYIYYEALRFFAVKQCLSEFEKILILFKDEVINRDIADSFYFHGKTGRDLGKVYISLLSGNAKKYINDLSEPYDLDFSSVINCVELKSRFSSFWWSLQNSEYNDYATYGPHVAVCGNVSNENYAYSPASIKLLDAVARCSRLPIIFYNSGLLPATGQDDVKSITLKESLSDRCSVYNGFISRYRKKYSQEIIDDFSLFDGLLKDRVMFLARQRLPEDFLGIFKARVQKYIESLFAQTIFTSEAGQAMRSAVMYSTSMERNPMSRILTAIAKENKIPTIGIQPQIVSTSARYSSPAVDIMGVIDTSQVETYKKLGAIESQLKITGSVNIISRLKSLDEATINYNFQPSRKSIFFAMQHSNAYEMLETAHALKDICVKHELSMIVKPHPHQELPILNEVRAIFSGVQNVKVLSRESDTYAAVAKCAIVVGLFSSVLLESALYGKDVLVAAFRDLDPSIDFSKQGLALKVLSPAALESALLEIINDGDLARKLSVGRAEYLSANPQFSKPYSTAFLDDFIASSIPEKYLVSVL